MNAFEQIAAHFFEVQGYWTRVAYKIDVSKEEKRELGNPSMPRLEVDLLAFRPGSNQLLVMECKSWLDSTGVRVANFGEDPVHNKHMKLFNRDGLRELLTSKLLAQLRQEGLLPTTDPSIRYGLVAGKIKAGNEPKIREIFDAKDWLLVTPSDLASGLRKFADRGYEDDVATMVVKILERNAVS
jgi:hypothetical protein